MSRRSMMLNNGRYTILSYIDGSDIIDPILTTGQVGKHHFKVRQIQAGTNRFSYIFGMYRYTTADYNQIRFELYGYTNDVYVWNRQFASIHLGDDIEVVVDNISQSCLVNNNESVMPNRLYYTTYGDSRFAINSYYAERVAVVPTNRQINRWYYYKAYNNSGVLIRDMVPAYDNKTGWCGLLDLCGSINPETETPLYGTTFTPGYN